MKIDSYIKKWSELILKESNEYKDDNNSSYPMFVTSLEQLAETGINEGSALDVDYIQLENNTALGKIAFGLLQKFLLKRGGNKIDSAQFCSSKSMNKLLQSLKIEFKDDIDKWMQDKMHSREPIAALQIGIKNALRDPKTCFLIMHVKDGYNPSDYDEDTRYRDNQSAANIVNDIISATGLSSKYIPSGMILSNGSQYVIAAF